MNKEIWKDVKGYEDLYQVSNFGRVKSLQFSWQSPSALALGSVQINIRERIK